MGNGRDQSRGRRWPFYRACMRTGTSTFETTSADVLGFLRTPRAQRVYDEWRQRPGCKHVVEFVMAHRTRVPYVISSNQVRRICERTSHALGEICKEQAESVLDHAAEDARRAAARATPCCGLHASGTGPITRAGPL